MQIDNPPLEHWLGLSLAALRGKVAAGTAYAQPTTALAARPLFDWQVLARVLAARPDVLVVANGQLLDVPPPRSLADLTGYLRAGVGLCIRGAEHHDPGLAGLVTAFAGLGAARVQLFVTPGRSHGFGWHYDDEDVFITQTLGCKNYYFRANTICPDVAANGAVFARYPQERSALCAATLIAGDFLYVPARWWHMAVCEQTALSISVGVTRAAG